MSLFPPDSEEKVIIVPFGDQRGEWVLALRNVNCCGLELEESATQISELPERSDAKAILEPSGLTCGNCSKRVDAATCVGFPDLADKSSFQIFVSLLAATNTILPECEVVAESPNGSDAGLGRGLLADGARRKTLPEF